MTTSSAMSRLRRYPATPESSRGFKKFPKPLPACEVAASDWIFQLLINSDYLHKTAEKL